MCDDVTLFQHGKIIRTAGKVFFFGKGWHGMDVA